MITKNNNHDNNDEIRRTHSLARFHLLDVDGDDAAGRDLVAPLQVEPPPREAEPPGEQAVVPASPVQSSRKTQRTTRSKTIQSNPRCNGCPPVLFSVLDARVMRAR